MLPRRGVAVMELMGRERMRAPCREGVVVGGKVGVVCVVGCS